MLREVPDNPPRQMSLGWYFIDYLTKTVWHNDMLAVKIVVGDNNNDFPIL